jgi:hypothetical protein
MKALEFLARLESGRPALELPPDVAAQLPTDRPVRVLVLVEDEATEQDEEAAWKGMAAEQFLNGSEHFVGLYDDPGFVTRQANR